MIKPEHLSCKLVWMRSGFRVRAPRLMRALIAENALDSTPVSPEGNLGITECLAHKKTPPP